MYVERTRNGRRNALFRSIDPGLATLFGLFLAAHIALACVLGLSVDEAHYALYAVHLDWSYFDHPPLVGWLQGPALLLGGGDGAIRCAPFVCWLLTLALARRLAGSLFPSLDATRIPDAALLALLTAPMFHLLGFALLPESLLLPETCAVMLLTWQLRDPEEVRRPALWVGLGVALGLAGLSHYLGVFLAFSSAAVLFRRHGGCLLASPWPWVASLVSLAMISPVLLWNADHGWISFAYQFRHASGVDWHATGGLRAFLGYHRPTPPPFRPGWEASKMGTAALAQIAAFGPLLLVGVVRGWRKWPRHPAIRFCIAFALPPLVIVALLAGFGGSLPHWTGFAWMAAVPVAAAAIAEGWKWPGTRRWLAAIAAVQAALCCAAFAAAWSGAPQLSTVNANPFADLYGWNQAGERAQALAAACHVEDLAVCNWTLASRLGWYARPLPVHVLDRRLDQFALWYGRMPVGGSAILVNWSQMAFRLPISRGRGGGFAACRPLGTLVVRRFGREISRFSFYLASDWRGPMEPVRAVGRAEPGG